MKFDKYEKLGAYHWDWYDDPNWAWYKECADKCVNFCKGGLTLDIGGGDGFVASKLENSLVLDSYPDLYKLLHDEQYFCVCDLDNIESINEALEYDQYEYMVCLNTIEHLKQPNNVKYIFEKFITKAGIIITDKATDSPGRYHEHEFTKQELLGLFKEFKPKYFEINSTEFSKPITFIGVEIKK
jgi:hypothetical protein